MFDRGRLHNIAIKGCVALALLLAFSSDLSRAQNNASAPAQQPQKQQPAPAPSPIIKPPLTEPDYYKIRCEAPKDHDAADLCEQRRMAKSAEEAVVWASWQTWIAGLGFSAIIISLIFTGIATKAASRSARAAERALTDLERPFVYVEVTDKGLGMTGAGELTPHGQFVFECVNLGRTPADLLDIRDDIVECEREQWPDPVIPVQNPRTLPPGTVASADRPYVFRINLRERVNVYVDNDKNLFFIGYVRYADVFGGTYLTGFCAIFDRIGMRFVLRGDHRYNYTRKESE